MELAPPPRLLRAVLDAPRRGRRRLVAVAGCPASGKSTLAAALVAAARAEGVAAANVPMDGFHLDNRILDARGLRPRKGAPETFDAEGFVALIRRLREGGEVVHPLFDRTRDLAVAGAGVVPAECDLAVVEGNYLLFEADPWRALADLWDLSVWIETPESVLRDRLVRRWLDHGHSEEAALRRAETNDLPNARRVAAARLPADMVVDDAAP